MVNGGTPYEKDVAVEASVTRECKKAEKCCKHTIPSKNTTLTIQKHIRTRDKNCTVVNLF